MKQILHSCDFQLTAHSHPAPLSHLTGKCRLVWKYVTTAISPHLFVWDLERRYLCLDGWFRFDTWKDLLGYICEFLQIGFVCRNVVNIISCRQGSQITLILQKFKRLVLNFFDQLKVLCCLLITCGMHLLVINNGVSCASRRSPSTSNQLPTKSTK